MAFRRHSTEGPRIQSQLRFANCRRRDQLYSLSVACPAFVAGMQYNTLAYCTFLMRQQNHPFGQFPTGCPPFDKLVYGPVMKDARAAYREAQAAKTS